jgi:hypothetical protein
MMLVQDSIPPYVFEDLGAGFPKKVKPFVTHDESIRLSEPLPRSKEAPLLNGSDPSAQSAEPEEEKKEAAPAKKSAAKDEKAPAEESKKKSSDATTAKADEGASFVQQPTKDIGRSGYDRDVYHFVREDTNVQPTPWPRRETPFDSNGSDPKSHVQ